MQWFFVFGGQVIPVAKFDGETRHTVACASCDVTVGETSFRRQIETMLLQAACKRLYSTNKRFSSVPLTSCTLTYPRSSNATYLYLATPLTSSTPHVPSIFSRYSPAFSLCFSPSRPNSSIRQRTRFQCPCDILHLTRAAIFLLSCKAQR